MNKNTLHTVYFIGIGGIGMSALARYYNERGVSVFGYDRVSTPLTQQLENEGITIYYHENASNIPVDTDLVVYTPAIPASNTELSFAIENHIPVKKRAEVLGIIVNSGDCFAVAGSHGKSSTSAMLTHLFKVAGRNPSGFLGAITANYQSNYISGSSDIFVVEADEFDRSFHQIKPLSTIITSVDSDHLDIYGSLEGVEDGFLTYLSNVKQGGTVFIHAGESFKDKIDQNYFTYGIDIQADYIATNIRLQDGAYMFDVITPNETIADIVLRMGGRYNIENAVAVIAMATYYGVSASDCKLAFHSFTGLYRRFEFVLQTDEVTFIDDYAHHPNEIRAFIEGVRELYPQKNILGIFQPHLYSRTKDYATHFAHSLSLLDKALVMDIYPAREEPIPGVSSSLIVDQVGQAKASLIKVEEIPIAISNCSADIVVTIGAGDISKQVPVIKEILKSCQL